MRDPDEAHVWKTKSKGRKRYAIEAIVSWPWNNNQPRWEIVKRYNSPEDRDQAYGHTWADKCEFPTRKRDDA